MNTPGKGWGALNKVLFTTFTYIIMHLVYTLHPLPILHKIGFQFLLGITVVPREIQDSDYHGKIWGETRCTMVYVKMVITGEASR